MIDTADLKEYVNAGSATDVGFLQDCLTAAIELVDAEIGSVLTVPESIRDRAVLECASELFHRRNAPNGIAQYNDMTGAPVRVARDPMLGARPLLSPWVVYGV